ncbi:hypothetical protein MLD38_006830 [Melastoma candidum]|uniref:Uncharacterized protein n=1 Tax=Melastoma candidum TaxID=119954 RepID=A0ACB9RQG2_9MYRT|nr:hypothetical protein MLD38_006830 [Melastoma candidum]
MIPFKLTEFYDTAFPDDFGRTEHTVSVPEWLSGMTRNHVGSARAGSNPAAHVFEFSLILSVPPPSVFSPSSSSPLPSSSSSTAPASSIPSCRFCLGDVIPAFHRVLPVGMG